VIERAILDAADQLRRSREPFLVATVVAVTGSAYRRPGARMLIAQDRWVAGSVSGGCLEGDVLRRGWWRTETGAPVVVTYDSRVDATADAETLREGLGLGCNGVVDVLLERDGRSEVDPFDVLSRCRTTQRRGALVTVFASGDPDIPIGARLAVDDSGAAEGALGGATLAFTSEAMRAIRTGSTSVHSVGSVRALVEAVVPPPKLFVLGAGHDAVPLVELARTLGWDVVVSAPTLRTALRERFAAADQLVCGAPDELVPMIDAADRAACVVMNHNYAHDVACLGAVLRSRATYIGALGPRHRTNAILAELGHGIEDPRLHAPVGLALGAETPVEIALSISAEIQAVLSSAAATSLRERGDAIHALREVL
jgi:xanthine/CO dehydrogenase XdhC/CoxF family maturation factor